MRPIVVVPATATDRVRPLLESLGWGAASGSPPGGDDQGSAAVAAVRAGEPALYVPPEATPAATVRRIVVLHEGSREARASMDLADDAALASGAEIVVLYAPRSRPSTTSASLPFRIADHGTYDWNEWRDEFLRRFCRCSPGVRVSLRVSAGSAETLRNQLRDEAAELVIVSGPGDGGDAGEDLPGGAGEVLDEALESGAPVLIVPATGRDRSAMDDAELGQPRLTRRPR